MRSNDSLYQQIINLQENVGSISKALSSLRNLASQTTLASLAAEDFATQTTLAQIKTKTDNLDVALSTRLKPADTLTAVTTVGTITNAVDAKERGLEVSRGNVAGQTMYRKFGANPAIGTSETYVASIGGTAPYMPTVATTVRIKAGGNAADTAAGAGAREITIIGLDETFTERTVTLATAGASASASTVVTFLRIYWAYVSSIGTYGAANTGAITIEATAGGDFAQILAGKGQTQGTGYCVPAGYSLYIFSYHVTVDSNKACTLSWYQRPNADDVSSPFSGAKRVISEIDGLIGQLDFDYRYPLKFSAKTDLWWTALVGTGTGKCSVEYEGVLVAN